MTSRAKSVIHHLSTWEITSKLREQSKFSRTFISNSWKLCSALLHSVQTLLGHTQGPIQWIPGVERRDSEGDRSDQFSDEVEKVELRLHSPLRLHGAVFPLTTRKDSFTSHYSVTSQVSCHRLLLYLSRARKGNVPALSWLVVLI